METLLGVVQRVVLEMAEEPVSSIYSTEISRRVASIAVDVFSSIMTEYPYIIKETIIEPERIDFVTVTLPKSSQRIKVVKYSGSGKCCGKESPAYFEDPTTKKLCEVLPKDNWNSCVPRTYLIPNFAPRTTQYYSENCTELSYLSLEDFLACHRNKPDCESVYIDAYHLHVPTNKDPEYYTIINGKVVVDSLCKEDSSKLMKQRLTIIGQTSPTIELSDTTIVDLPLEFFNYFLNEVKSMAFYTLKGIAHEKYETMSQRLRRGLLRTHGLQNEKRTDYRVHYGAAFRRGVNNTRRSDRWKPAY